MVRQSNAMVLGCNVDFNCGYTYSKQAGNALKRGYTTEDAIDRALVCDFSARMQTGEFEPDGTVPYADPAVYGKGKQLHAPAHDRLAEELADQAVVLLKNDTVRRENAALLPLGNREIRRFVLVGTMAEKLTLGGYSTNQPGNTSTALHGICAALKRIFPKAEFAYIRGKASGEFLKNVRAPQMLDADGKVIGMVDFGKITRFSGCRLETKRGVKNIGYIGAGAAGSDSQNSMCRRISNASV